MSRPKQIAERARLTQDQIDAASYVGSAEHNVSRWWGGLPRARVGRDGVARRPKKQLTSICDLLAEADRIQATEWVRQALRQERFRFYEGDQTYPKHIWHQDESGRYWFGFCINGTTGTYKGWPIDEAEKRAIFD